MSKMITKGFALVDDGGTLHSLLEGVTKEAAELQRDALVAAPDIVVCVFEVEANRDAWDRALMLIAICDRKSEAWQVILTEGRVL